MHRSSTMSANMNKNLETSTETTSIEAAAFDSLPSPPAKPSPFLITRILLALLPRSWTTLPSAPFADPSSHKPPRSFNPLFFLDFFFSSSFSLVWASALGHQLTLDNFRPLPPSRHIATKIPDFNAGLAYFLGKDTADKKPRSRIPLLRTLITVFKFHILEGIFYHSLYLILLFGQIFVYKVLLVYLTRFYEADGSSPLPNLSHGVALIVGAFVMLFISQAFYVRAMYVMSTIGGEMKTLLSATVTAKGFVISPLAHRTLSVSSKKDAVAKSGLEDEVDLSRKGEDEEINWTTGTILTLVNTDSERITLAMQNINVVWPPLPISPYSSFLNYHPPHSKKKICQKVRQTNGFQPQEFILFYSFLFFIRSLL